MFWDSTHLLNRIVKEQQHPEFNRVLQSGSQSMYLIYDSTVGTLKSMSSLGGILGNKKSISRSAQSNRQFKPT